MSNKEKQIKNSFLYILPNIVSGLLPIVTLPVFTRILTVADYGVYALASIYAILLSGIVNFGLTASYERNFFQYKDKEKTAELLYSTLAFVLAGFLIATAITYLFKKQIAKILIGSAEYDVFLLWVFLATVIMSLKQYFLIYFKNTENAKDFIIYTIDESLIGVLLSLFFVVYMKTGIIGLAWGQLFASTTIFLALIMRFLKIMPFCFKWDILKDSLKISLPLTPRIFIGVVSTQLNKLVLSLLNTLGGVGIFSIAQKIGNLTFVFMTAVQNVFNPYVYKKMFSRSSSAGREIGEYLTPFAYLSIFVCMLASLFSQEAIWLFTGPSFYASAPLVSILSMYYGFLFFGKINGIQLIFKKKTFFTSVLTFLDIGVGVAISIPFIMKFGVIGAAWATFLASIITGSFAFLISQHYFRIQWEVRKIVAIFSLFCFSSLLTLFTISGSFVYLQCLILKLFCLGVYVYLGIRLNIITSQNLALLWGIATFKKIGDAVNLEIEE
jgi:O-antigen/teichoic acid export membrane protein